MKYPAYDREMRIRYLLNFIGLNPVAYFTGQFLAEFILYSIPCSLLWLVTYALRLDVFTKNGPLFFSLMLAFGVPAINLVYIAANRYDTLEDA